VTVVPDTEENTMQAQDVMNRAVITVRPHIRVESAAALLAAHGVTSAPVVTAEGMLRGIVSEADLLRARPVADSAQTTETAVTAADVMTPQPVTVRPTDDLADVAAVLLDRGVRAVPVVDGERLVGILSRRDVLTSTGPEPVATTA
jgi:CBS domain-containing protein